uniref:Glycosyl hydrolase family 13 catalytic domain-containing protein n=1 Tax=Megaselia scalaris TaxID=36166 RepID=T1GGD0_MEGSC
MLHVSMLADFALRKASDSLELITYFPCIFQSNLAEVDAVPNLFEVAPSSGVYPDEPINPNEPDEDNYEHLQHKYVIDQPETIDMVYQWREVLMQHENAYGGDERILMIETYSVPSYSNQMYGNKTTEGAQIPFNFNLITKVHQDTNAQGVVEAINAWMEAMPSGEEIGMLDVELSWEETVDPAACNSNSDIYELFSRDPCRTP